MRSLLFLLLVVASLVSTAQLRLGAYAGTNNATFSSIPRDSTKLTQDLGVIAGLQLEYEFRDDLLFSLEPGYAVERSRVAAIDTVWDADEQVMKTVWKDTAYFSYSQFVLPVLFKGLSKKRRWSFVGGMAFAFPIKLRLYDEDTEVRSNELRKMSLEGVLGLAYQVNIKKSALDLGLRYHQSLTRITDFNEDLMRLSGLKTSSIRFLVSWRIQVNKRKEE